MTSEVNTATALVIEDEKEIRRFLRNTLREADFRVHEAETLRAGLAEIGARIPDIIVLDLGLPDGDGVDLIREVRTWSSVPIIVLSARVDEGNKVRALDAGADDYVTKPFGTAELLARVRASLRRITLREDGQSIIAFGAVCVDLPARIVTRDGSDVHLTPIEYRLLTALLAHPGKVLTHRHLLREVWGSNYVEHNHYLRIYMANLRHKLEDDPSRPKHFITEVGVGYRFLG